MPTKLELRLVPPKGEKWKVRPKRRPNREIRTKEYLTEAEMERLINAAKGNRWGFRDATLLLTMYRHGLRASEVIDLRWDQIDWNKANLHVRRLKGGTDSVHTILGDELRALRRLQREQEPKSAFVFISERGGPMTRFAVNKLVEKAGETAGLGDHVHPHQIRHATGFKLANDGHDTRRLQSWLGHSDIKHTVKYSELSAQPFKNFWR
jgi:integrase